LVVNDAAAALDFYKRAFNAEEVMRLPTPDGKIGHAEIKIGDSHVMLADEFPQWGRVGPKALGNTPVSLMIYVEDVDARFQQAVNAGATVLRPVVNQFYGDRSGSLEDPFGHQWTIGTHVEDVPNDEIARRMAAMSAEG
jgi:PhnB protein